MSKQPAAVPPTRVTMKEVAARAGVGVKTVSRVLNGEPNVARSTAAKVLDAARSLDYHLDLSAGSIRRSDGRTGALGLLVGSVDNPFCGAIQRGVENEASRRGAVVFASSMDEDEARERSAVEAFLRRRVDGLILTSICSDHDYLRPTIQHGRPVVFVDRSPSDVRADCVVSDNAAGAVTATRHLLGHGHRDIAFLGDRPTILTAAQRRDAFAATMLEAGVAPREELIVTGLRDEEEARAALDRLLDLPDPPSAVFSAQNLVTLGSMRALRARSLQRKIALIGFDDLPVADLLDPGLTAVVQQPSRLGEIAAQRVFDRLEQPDLPPQSFLVPTQLIARGSGEIRPGN